MGNLSDRPAIMVYPWGGLKLWALLLVFGGPTATLFYLDRRHVLPNHCQNCGYNLTDNVSGVCPECGQGIA